MYLSTNYLISFFHVPRLCCAVYIRRSSFLSLSFFLFFHFHTFFSSPSNALSYVRLHSCNCLHVNDLYKSRFRFFLYQFGQIKIRDIGDIVIVLLLLEQLKYTHARTVSSNYFVCLLLIFFFSLLRIRVFLVYAVEIDLQRDGSMDAFFFPKLNVLLLKRHIESRFALVLHSHILYKNLTFT